MNFYLRFTNKWDDRWTEERGSVHWFCNLGGFWGAGDTRRCIERTTRRQSEARAFESVEQCRETLLMAGRPKDWEIVDQAGVVVE